MAGQKTVLSADPCYEPSLYIDEGAAIKAPKILPSLDGLRAVSIALVLAAHSSVQHGIAPGGLGVTIFFVISGFLITRLMLEEIHATGTLNVRFFYLRRVFRLMPTLLLCLVLFVPLLLALGAEISFVQIASAVLYLANYYHIYVGYPLHSPFPILWSLAVEEHFYIIFPFLVLALRKHLHLLAISVCAAILLILLWRVHLNAVCMHASLVPYGLCGLSSGVGDRIFHGTDSIMDCILFGVLASLMIHLYPQRVQQILVNDVALYLSFAVMLFSLLYRDIDFRQTIRYSLQASSTAVIILNLVFGRQPVLRAVLESAIVVLIGRWSYALYVYHFAVIKVIELLRGRPNGLDGQVDLTFYLIGSLVLAGLTYHFVEVPMKKLRRSVGSKTALQTQPSAPLSQPN